MLRKRTRSLNKDQSMSDSNTLFGVPGLFIGLSSKTLADSDSVWSPTSPLEFRVFSGLGNSNRSLRSVHDGHQKSPGGCKVGLGIVDSLDDDHVKVSGKISHPSESKNILFGPRIRTKTSSCKSRDESFEVSISLPKSFSILSQTKIKSPLQKGSSGVESKPRNITYSPSHLSVGSNASYKWGLGSTYFYMESLTSQLSSMSMNDESLNLENPLNTQLNFSSDGFMTGSLSASEIELSEDYTCVISHGPNPKTTHIFCDCILEGCQAKFLIDSSKKEEKEIGLPKAFINSEVPHPYPSNGFLSVCHFCNKKLQDDEDIYIYRGDTSFCSLECRCQGISIEEEKEKSTNKSNDSPNPDKGRKLFETGIFVEL